MAEEEKRQKAAFRKKVRALFAALLHKPEHLDWIAFSPTKMLTCTHATCLFRWRKKCQILFKTVHNRNESTSLWGRLKGASCKLLALYLCFLPGMCFSTFIVCISYSFSLFRHDVAEVAGLTSFSFGEDEESRYVMLFKKVCTFFF